MNLDSAQDILNVAMRFAGEITDAPPAQTASEYRSVALVYLNRIYLAILSGGNEFNVEMAEPFSWALSQTPGTLVIQPAVQTTASINQGATVGSFATAPMDQWGNTISVQGCYFRVDNWADTYLITSHIAGQTAFTIDLGYLEPSQASVPAWCYFLTYTLAQNMLRLTAPMRIFQVTVQQRDCEIKGSDISAMRREFPISFLQTRYPDRFAIVGQNTVTNEFTVQINTNPPDTARVEYDYVPFPANLTDSTSSIPIVPNQHRMVMAYAVAYYICNDKNDNRAQGFFAQTQQGLISMVKAAKKQRADTNWDRARVTPRQDLQRRRSTPWWWGWW